MVALYADGSIVEEGSPDDPNLLPAAVVHDQTPRTVEEVLKAQVKEAGAPGGGEVTTLTHPDNDPSEDPKSLLEGDPKRLGKTEDGKQEALLSAIDSGKTPPPAPVAPATPAPAKATPSKATPAKASNNEEDKK
jgi:hypothetical protein